MLHLARRRPAPESSRVAPEPAAQTEPAPPGAVAVHPSYDRVAVVVDGHTAWLTLTEVHVLRHQLMMAARELLTYSAANDLPQPRRG